jgi:hypothetical protein
LELRFPGFSLFLLLDFEGRGGRILEGGLCGVVSQLFMFWGRVWVPFYSYGKTLLVSKFVD